jgi:membrane-associated phospholipid phosphatase
MKNNEQFTPRNSRSGRAVWICVAAAWVLATIGTYLFLDSIVSRWLWDHPITWHTNFWVNGFRQIGRAGVPIWLTAVWSCVTGKWRPAIVVTVALVLVAVSVCPLKAIARRTRPIHTLIAASGQSQPEVPWQKKVSFPSGDAAVAFASATALSLSWGRFWTPALFVAATAIGVLRITAFAHYPSDVMAAALIGVLCGMAAMSWTRRWWPLDQLRVEGRWPSGVALVVICVLPVIGPYIGNGPALFVFLRVYAIPLIVLILIYLGVVRLRGRRPESERMET